MRTDPSRQGRPGARRRRKTTGAGQGLDLPARRRMAKAAGPRRRAQINCSGPAVLAMSLHDSQGKKGLLMLAKGLEIRILSRQTSGRVQGAVCHSPRCLARMIRAAQSIRHPPGRLLTQASSLILSSHVAIRHKSKAKAPGRQGAQA